MSASFDRLLEEQIVYYRARAGEYDEWFLRQGRYDRGPDLNRRWFDEVHEVVGALDAFAPTGRVLELAGGTGLWTERLVRSAESLTVVDASPEALAINRSRLGESKVRYVEADIFSWRPDQLYDAVFFGFWLSHVPPERFASFWSLVRSSLAPGGRVFFVDSAYNEATTAVNHRLDGPDALTATRRLNDGREFQIVKVFYRPADLAAKLAGLGWNVKVRATESNFVYGFGNISTWEESMTGRVAAVSRSATHTLIKGNEPAIQLIQGLGVDGDAHAGVTVKHRSRVARDPSQPNLRQVHLIHAELHEELKGSGFDVSAGQMGENITTEGLDLLGLPTGTRLHLGDEAIVEITGLRNPCAQLDQIQNGLMAAVLDRDEQGNLIRKAGIMGVVIAGGQVRQGDAIAVELPPAPHRPLEPV